MVLRATGSGLRAYQQAQTALESQVNEALRMGGTQPFQAVRKLQAAVEELRELVLRLPQNVGRQVDEGGWSLTSYPAWQTLVSVTIPRPENSTRVVVSTSSSVTALANASEFGAVAFDTRIVVNGTSSAIQPGMLEPPGAQYQRCSGYPSFVREIAGLAGSVSVQLQARGLGYNALTSQNQATLSVTAGFSTV